MINLNEEYRHPTMEEMIAAFEHMNPQPRMVFIATYPPPRKYKGVVYGDAQREQRAVENVYKNGALIVGAGADALEKGIMPGDFAYIHSGTAGQMPPYMTEVDGIIMRAVEMHFIVATREATPQDNNPYAED